MFVCVCVCVCVRACVRACVYVCLFPRSPRAHVRAGVVVRSICTKKHSQMTCHKFTKLMFRFRFLQHTSLASRNQALVRRVEVRSGGGGLSRLGRGQDRLKAFSRLLSEWTVMLLPKWFQAIKCSWKKRSACTVRCCSIS